MSLSRPIYAPLELDASGRRHLVLVYEAEAPAFAQEPAFIQEQGIATLWWGGPADPPPGAHVYPSAKAMLGALTSRLAVETMGLRLYAQGSEGFLWDVFRTAQAGGLGRGEVRLARVGDWVRRVFCVHCGRISDGVRQTLATCPGCGATLFVRDHFSRRLGAFMGVQADAEAAGELPTAEVLAS